MDICTIPKERQNLHYIIPEQATTPLKQFAFYSCFVAPSRLTSTLVPHPRTRTSPSDHSCADSPGPRATPSIIQTDSRPQTAPFKGMIVT